MEKVKGSDYFLNALHAYSLPLQSRSRITVWYEQASLWEAGPRDQPTTPPHFSLNPAGSYIIAICRYAPETRSTKGEKRSSLPFHFFKRFLFSISCLVHCTLTAEQAFATSTPVHSLSFGGRKTRWLLEDPASLVQYDVNTGQCALHDDLNKGTNFELFEICSTWNWCALISLSHILIMGRLLYRAINHYKLKQWLHQLSCIGLKFHQSAL